MRTCAFQNSNYIKKESKINVNVTPIISDNTCDHGINYSNIYDLEVVFEKNDVVYIIPAHFPTYKISEFISNETSNESK